MKTDRCKGIKECLQRLKFLMIPLYIFDVGSDIVLISVYYTKEDVIYCGLTFIFVLGPLIITNLGTIIKLGNESLFPNSTLCQVLKWIFRFFSLGALWMSIELHLYECCCGRSDAKDEKRSIDNVKNRKNDTEIGNRDSEEIRSECSIAIIDKEVTENGYQDEKLTPEKVRVLYSKTIRRMSLWEALTEASPQLYLQLYIMIKSAQVIRSDIRKCLSFGLSQNDSYLTGGALHKENWTDQVSSEVIFQTCSIFTSLLSISFSLTNYMGSYQEKDKAKEKRNTISRANTSNDIDNPSSHFMRRCTCNNSEETSNAKISWKDLVILFLWQLCLIVSNMFSLSLFASVYTFWFIVPLIYRIIFQRTFEFCILKEDPCKMSMSFFDTSFLTIKFCKNCHEFPLRFISISFTYRVMESSCLVTLWCWAVDPQYTWFYWWCIGIHIGGIVLQLAFMLIYLCRVKKSNENDNLSNKNCNWWFKLRKLCTSNQKEDKHKLVP